MNLEIGIMDTFLILLAIGIILGIISKIIDKIRELKKDLDLKLTSSFKKKWRKLGLESYNITRRKVTVNSDELEVKIPVGKSFSDIKKFEGVIEKAYECVCEIKDCEYTSYAKIIMQKK